MLLNIDNQNKIIDIEYVEDREFFNEENDTSGFCGLCTNGSGQFVLIIVKDKNDEYTLLHEFVHSLQMLDIPIINDSLNLISDEIKDMDADYYKNMVDWVNENYNLLYDNNLGIDYNTFINNELQAHLITDVYEVGNGDVNSFIGMIEEITDYRILLNENTQ